MLTELGLVEAELRSMLVSLRELARWRTRSLAEDLGRPVEVSLVLRPAVDGDLPPDLEPDVVVDRDVIPPERPRAGDHLGDGAEGREQGIGWPSVDGIQWG